MAEPTGGSWTGTPGARTSEVAEARRLAVATGDLATGLAEKISSLPKMSSAERERLAREGLTQLHSRDFLTDAELARLGDVVGALFAADLAQHGKMQLADNVLQELVRADARPVALALASVASKSARAVAMLVNKRQREQTDEVAADIGDFSTWQECACAGGIVGATAGIVLGPGGVLIGAAAGAAGGAIASVVADELLS
jgi:hypothetical protein